MTYYLRIFFQIITKVKLKDLLSIIFNRPCVISLDNYSFKIRNFMDLYIVIETIYIQVYPVDVNANNPTIIDIGASLGDFTVFCSHQYPQSKIYAIEPELSSYAILSENIALNHCLNVIPLNIALSQSSKTISLAVNTSNYGHSNSFSKSTTQKIKAISLNQLLTSNSISHCHLLKSDSEGAEYDYLLGASQTTLQKIDKIVMEYHLYNSQQRSSFPKLVAHLKESGFHVLISPNPVNKHIGYIVANTRR